ncbi:MAG: hypothetical protein H6541_08185 [Lentimicrobiaceae bacterium]|nr:hypothetical protein [Lentimicrobiaceae bacterium]MCO5264398.1 hypothetical protein [Lentimicrobium sp.]
MSDNIASLHRYPAQYVEAGAVKRNTSTSLSARNENRWFKNASMMEKKAKITVQKPRRIL